MNRILFLFLSLIFISGNLTAQIKIPKSKLYSPDVYKYKVTGYFSRGGGKNGVGREYTSGAYQEAIVLDEARITKVEGNEVFFEVLVRAHTSEDQPVSEMTVKVNGDKTYPVDEEVSVTDYEYEGERVIANLEKIDPQQLINLKITQKETRIFRVISRKITFSYKFDKGFDHKIRLAMSHGSGYTYRTYTFEWEIVD